MPPTQVEGLYGIIAVEPREYDVTYKFKHVLALREDGVIVSWGDNANGQYNTAWRTAITEITVDGVVLATNKYQIGDGTITINTNDTEVFPEAKDYLIVVKATNYTDVSVTQTVNAPPIDECFIATASFGSKFEPSVVLLRAFRDKFLLTNTWGQAFVKFYYKNSPPIAAYIANNEFLKAGVRGLLTPVVGVVYLLFHPALLYSLVSALILLIAAIFFLKRRRGVTGRV